MKPVWINRAFRFPSYSGEDGVCDVRVYASADGHEAVVLVIEDDRNLEHTSITNRATEVAARVFEMVQSKLAPEVKLRWVEVYANLVHPEPVFDWMVFTSGFSSVSWSPAWRTQVEALIGTRIPDLPDGDEREVLETW
jgi:hypothetical protein